MDLLAERLTAFKIDNWCDRKGIDPGERWDNEIRSALSESKIVLVLIGPEWQNARLDDPNDWVRREVLLAQEMNIEIVPVFLDGFRPPLDVGRLPEPLRFLAKLQGYPIDRDFFDRDADHFSALLKKQLRALVTPSSNATPTGSRSAPVLRQVIAMMVLLALVTVVSAVIPAWFAALPAILWVLPALMLLSAFMFFLYLLAQTHLRSLEAA
jgi:hypothetical protein